jgi:glycosyltransferase involved in cell wall biosynthesis
MKTSVLIIAHNEEQHIEQCIHSVLQQTQPADEVVLIVHNSTDSTATIARRFPVTVIEAGGEAGPVYARLAGLAQVSGDIILCIDGDAFAERRWIEEMTTLLQKDQHDLVGSFIHFEGSLFDDFSNIWNGHFCVSKNSKATRWIWGASMAFWGRDKEIVKDIFEKSIVLSKQLNLSRIPEDYWLALFMSKRGNMAVTNETFVIAYAKDASFRNAVKRNKENHLNGKAIRDYFLTT